MPVIATSAGSHSQKVRFLHDFARSEDAHLPDAGKTFSVKVFRSSGTRRSVETIGSTFGVIGGWAVGFNHGAFNRFICRRCIERYVVFAAKGAVAQRRNRATGHTTRLRVGKGLFAAEQKPAAHATNRGYSDLLHPTESANRCRIKNPPRNKPGRIGQEPGSWKLNRPARNACRR